MCSHCEKVIRTPKGAHHQEGFVDKEAGEPHLDRKVPEGSGWSCVGHTLKTHLLCFNYLFNNLISNVVIINS